jgi:hypothetical protein
LLEACQKILKAFPKELQAGFSFGEIEATLKCLLTENYQTADENCHRILQTLKPEFKEYLILRPPTKNDKTPEYSFHFARLNINITAANSRQLLQILTSYKLCIDERKKKIKNNPYIWLNSGIVVSVSVYEAYENLAKRTCLFKDSNLISYIDDQGNLSEPKVIKGKSEGKYTVLRISQGGFSGQYDTMAVCSVSELGLLDLASEKKIFTEIELDRFADPRTFPTDKFNRCLQQNIEVCHSEWRHNPFKFPDVDLDGFKPDRRPKNIKEFY